MSDVTSLVPRRRADPVSGKSAAPSSDRIAADIGSLDREREAAAVALDRLASERRAVLLTDDDAAAERHDAEIARQRRAIERCDLRRPGLEQALAEAKDREEAERKAAQVAEAEASIAAVMAEIQTGYIDPAGKIAAFLRGYQEANDKARAAGIPTIDQRTRVRTATKEPDREEDCWMFVDESGALTHAPYGVMQYASEGPDGTRYDDRGKPIPTRPRRLSKRTVEGKATPAESAGELAGLVNLPGAHLGERDFHTATDLEPVDNNPRRRWIA